MLGITESDMLQFYLSGYNVTVTSGFPNQRKSLVSNQFPCNGGALAVYRVGSLRVSFSLPVIGGSTTTSGYYGTYTVLPAG